MPVHKVNVPNAIRNAIAAPIYDEMHQLKKTSTYKEMAKIFDCSPSTINCIVNGDIGSVSIDKLIPMADKLGIEISVVTSQAGEETITKITK
ncbi:hypothetical protein pETSU_099 [Edwardsiella phage pEt-SU]|uniref:HTH cro/C1-type domain-containing protein n=1 Tax=Edwardsiella phage pEt-SU TaxID=2562142 RepID=A0A4D6DWG7_9CAUD|nr:hypothetical protein HOV39_gp099 [Edwardsiella phage pEt-SU]QBZ70680.1 hypothetical protein pETSU_099 [Edwardsiella phage pEt-SU]